MASFGEELKRERESRGVSIGEIAESTKIGSSYLNALESNDFSSLPGRVFSRGYVRAYAEYLGIDPDPLVEAYSREEQAQEEDGKIASPDLLDGLRQAAPTWATSNGSGGIHRVWVLGGAAILVLVLALVGWWTLRPGSKSTPAPVVAQAPAEPSRPTVESPPPSQSREEQPASPAPVKAVAPKPAPVETPPARQEQATAVREPPPEPAEPEPAVESARELDPPTIEVPEFGVGTEVVDRKLVGQSDRFTEGSRVWFWTRVVGAGPGRPIRHVWLREGRVVDTIELKVGASHWRTYSRETLRPGSVGAWAVEARDAEGRVLARVEFLCIPADSDGAARIDASKNETAAS